MFPSFLALLCILNFNQLLTAQNPNPDHNTLQTYIVHVEPQSSDLNAFYDTFFATDVAAAAPRILHRYRHVLTGFSAKLSADELESLRHKEGFISARPERVYQLHTTHSPNFLGLIQNEGFWKGSNYGKGVIIGLLDTGITPGHPSFSDEGMPPPPAKWKGKCDLAPGACNNKLIGARRFGSGGAGTPADEVGHGTHTASTAGGNFVPGAGIFGNANGTAAGIAPSAHLAIYKVCALTGCPESDIMAGFDAAIEDGVDVLSVSLGGNTAPFYSDSIAIGAYRAMERGIPVVCSAGNSGPYHGSMSNEAPWILTVGAATLDRELTSTVVLGNGEELDGESARDFPPTAELEIVYPYDRESPYAPCSYDQLQNLNVAGKIVICELGGFVTRTGKGVAVKSAGGAAMILLNSVRQSYTVSAEAHVLPASHISFADATKLKAYLNSTTNPKAKMVFKGTLIGGDKLKPAPAVAYYSSRGPSVASPGILKPDIIGPGNNILAAWNTPLDNSSNNFNMISGTSMSCPHLSGVVALLKSAHPDWSPAAIKSAIMTTADQVNRDGKPIEDETLEAAEVVATGAGHVNPAKANDPGLVYDLGPDDYIPYLCGLNFSNEQVSMIVQRPGVVCSKQSSIAEAQLNYPSFSIRLGSTPQNYTRTVTNVGEANSVYKVGVVAPRGVDVKVNPATLQFSKVGQKLGYSVTFSGLGGGRGRKEVAQGVIRWSSSKHSVSSPVAVMFV
ncbi:subtilisin-like protease [Salvia miltiorrhiza]|uniref:subtilisin-like protease n=1 Tax=Salvia miltiorrhiza TaxID=226208 RepID=UPI0025AD7523|nr:subtilisin-like protease [Salvia miltiorrhiza]